MGVGEFKRLRHFFCGLKAVFRRFCQRFGDDLLQDFRDIRVNCVKRRWRRIYVLKEQSLYSSRTERSFAGQHLEQDDAKRIDICTRINWFGVDLFWSHVIGGTDDLIGARKPRIAAHGRNWPGADQRWFQTSVEEFSDAEVGEQEMVGVGGRDEHVLWFHIAM